MTVNKFIDEILLQLSLVNPRLRCPITRLQIQIEMQYPYLHSLFQYFIDIKSNYKEIWNSRTTTNKIQLVDLYAFTQIKDYMYRQKLLTLDEIEWLEDSIHEVLMDY